MMHNNGDYYFGGMHMFWWISLLVLFFAVIAWYGWLRKRK
jgi:hypothetical protein